MTRVLALVTLLIAACSAPGSAPAGIPATYAFAMTAGDAIVALDERGTVIGTIWKSPVQGMAPTGLSLSLDGRSLLFVISPPPDPRRGFGSDVWRIGTDGSGARAVVEHEEDYTFYASPVLDGSGNVLYVNRRSQTLKDGVPFGLRDEIVRVDLRTGERRSVVTDAADFAVSPDGRAIVYVHTTNGAPDTLWRVGTDGSEPQVLLPRDRWAYLQTPRFAPDGARVVFSAAGRSRVLGRSGTFAHLGIPSDLLVVGNDGSALREITRTNDDVWPAWSPDGAQVAYAVGGALRIVDLASGEDRDLARNERFLFAELVWVRR